MNAALVPTARALTIAVLAAPLALLVAALLPAAWALVPMAALGFALLVVVDGLLAARLEDWHIAPPPSAQVGRPARIAVLAQFARTPRAPRTALECDPLLEESGRLVAPLEPQAGDWSASPTALPHGRGQAAITRGWFAWHGPLGLARRQVEAAPDDATIAIRPDLEPLTSGALETVLRQAEFGTMARRLRGEGTQFEALREYAPGMDRRRIDWKASARHTALFARENEAERNNQIVFAFDCGQAMAEPIEGVTRLDRAVSAALQAAYVALKAGDRVALYGYARQPLLLSPFAAHTRGFARLEKASAGLEIHAAEANVTLGLATLATRLKRRSLIVLFGEFTDPTSAELMVESLGQLARRHLVLFVCFTDTQMADLAATPPDTADAIARAVAADTLVRQRALVLARLRGLGIAVIETPWERMGFDLIDAYLRVKRRGEIG